MSRPGRYSFCETVVLIAPNDLIFSYRWSCEAFEKLSGDVPDERFAEQPVEGINHPAWLFGHVGVYHGVIGHLLRGETFDNPWDAPCGKNSSPIADRSAYPSKDELFASHRSGYEAAIEAIERAPAEAWSGKINHPTWGKQFASAAPAVVYLATTHISLHLGQLSGWRRAAGLPRV